MKLAGISVNVKNEGESIFWLVIADLIRIKVNKEETMRLILILIFAVAIGNTTALAQDDNSGQRGKYGLNETFDNSVGETLSELCIGDFEEVCATTKQVCISEGEPLFNICAAKNLKEILGYFEVCTGDKACLQDQYFYKQRVSLLVRESSGNTTMMLKFNDCRKASRIDPQSEILRSIVLKLSEANHIFGEVYDNKKYFKCLTS